MAKKVYNKDIGWSWRHSAIKKNLKYTSFRLPKRFLELIDEWVSEGLIRTRSEFLRQCVYDKILDYKRMIDLCNNHPIVVKNTSPPLDNCFRPRLVKVLVDNPNIYNTEEDISK